MIFQITKFQISSQIITVFEYIRHYGPVILLLCITTSETGLFLLPHFVWKSQTIKIYDWSISFWRTSESHYSLSSLFILDIRSVIRQRMAQFLNIRFQAMQVSWGETSFFCLPWDCWSFRIFWAFYLYWTYPLQNLSTTFWIMPLLPILKKLWTFII